MIKQMMILSLLLMNVVSASGHQYENLDWLSKAVHAVHTDAPKISSSASDKLNSAAEKEGKSVKAFCEQQQASLLQCVPSLLAHTCQERASVFEKKDKPGEFGHTPLHLAAIKDNVTGALVLLAAGSNIDQRNNYGDTPLTLAARKGNRGIVRFLVKEGADVSLENNNGQTAAYLLQQKIKLDQEALKTLQTAAKK